MITKAIIHRPAFSTLRCVNGRGPSGSLHARSGRIGSTESDVPECDSYPRTNDDPQRLCQQLQVVQEGALVGVLKI